MKAFPPTWKMHFRQIYLSSNSLQALNHWELLRLTLFARLGEDLNPTIEMKHKSLHAQCQEKLQDAEADAWANKGCYNILGFVSSEFR
jgi:hypothetical protein